MLFNTLSSLHLKFHTNCSIFNIYVYNPFSKHSFLGDYKHDKHITWIWVLYACRHGIYRQFLKKRVTLRSEQQTTWDRLCVYVWVTSTFLLSRFWYRLSGTFHYQGRAHLIRFCAILCFGKEDKREKHITSNSHFLNTCSKSQFRTCVIFKRVGVLYTSYEYKVNH